MQPNVSVIIPTYRNATTLARAIDSVLTQKDYSSYEVIVVDDNDPGNNYRIATEDVMKQYDTNHQVKYIKHQKNRNGAAARNTGFRNSNGKLICLLDDDDIFLPTKLSVQVAFMDTHPQFGGSYTWRIDKNGKKVVYDKVGDLSKEILNLSFTPHTVTLMFRRECYEGINGFDERFKRHQDFEFLLRFFEKYKIGVVKQPLSQVMGKGDGVSRIHGKKFEELKKQFFKRFNSKIDEIDGKDPGFKKKVYGAHYAEVFASHIVNHHYLMAARIYAMHTLSEGGNFIKAVSMHYKEAIKRRLRSSGDMNG